MDDLLKEAIADAKAVRETALENAKIALEEAFTPRLQSMLSKKIQSEMEHGDEEEKDEAAHEEDEDMEERGTEERMHADEDDDVEERMNKDEDDDMEERMHADEDDDVEERMDDKDKDEAAHEEDEDMDENVIEIDGVKYAPVVSEEDDEDKDEAAHEGAHEDDDDVDEDLDLEAVLRELEEEEDEDKDEAMHADEDDDKVEENDVSSNIGSGDNKLDKKAGDTTAIGTKDKAKHNESVEIKEEEDEDEVDEEIDLEEVLAALSEEEDDDEKKDEVAELKSELDEHRNVVKYLRSKLNEVNLLNAKLLFTNKLFRAFGLTNDQKMKVVENFDRAHNLREVKLVYSTLAESFGTKTTKKEIKESKGTASKAVASTKSKKQEVIAEGSELRDRFKKLAGII